MLVHLKRAFYNVGLKAALRDREPFVAANWRGVRKRQMAQTKSVSPAVSVADKGTRFPLFSECLSGVIIYVRVRINEQIIIGLTFLEAGLDALSSYRGIIAM